MSTGGEIGEGGAYGRFDRISAIYDASRREFPSETVSYVIRHLAGDNPFVLDLGCGTGISTRQLAAGSTWSAATSIRSCCAMLSPAPA